jgi:hypothetical protein
LVKGVDDIDNNDFYSANGEHYAVFLKRLGIINFLQYVISNRLLSDHMFSFCCAQYGDCVWPTRADNRKSI